MAKQILSALAALVVAAFGSPAAQAEVLEKTRTVAGVTVQYKVVLPAGYDAARAYPAILALGGGPQTMNTVDGVLNRNLRTEAEKRGYIVVAPAAPEGQLFFEGGARLIPEFLKAILAEYKVQDGKFHVAGPSNGGIAAFHVAAASPQYFLSVTAFPGYMWHDEMKREADFLRARGTVARYTVEKGQPHRIETLAGVNASRLFDGFEETKKGCSR